MSLQWGRPIRWILANTDSQELSELRVRWSNNPWGDYRNDIQSAMIAAVIANCMSGRKQPYKVSDFMPTFEKPQPKHKTPGQMAAILNIMAKQLNKNG